MSKIFMLNSLFAGGLNILEETLIEELSHKLRDDGLKADINFKSFQEAKKSFYWVFGCSGFA